MGKTSFKIRNLLPNETKSVTLKANLTHRGIFNLNRFKINIKQIFPEQKTQRINQPKEQFTIESKAKDVLVSEYRVKDELIVRVIDLSNEEDVQSDNNLL